MTKTTGPQLGLVCITTTDEVRYRALTRKRLLQLDADEQRRVLRELYSDNLARLDRAVSFCHSRGIPLYRITSALLPFADDPTGEPLLEEFADVMRAIGERAERLGIRLVIHPDQFVVLNSESANVVANSIKIMKTHARIFDLLGLPRSPWAAMILHGGKGGRADELVETIRSLPEEIRTRLVFENDEHIYDAREILAVCRAAKVPMVFDVHHHIVHENLDSYEHPSIREALAVARTTWPVPEWQLVHVSNGRESFNDRRHSDLISTMPSSYRQAIWIEVEAKHKELAIEKLQREWLLNNCEPLAELAAQ
jgi:UV DNA damage endonuclease